MWQQGASYYLAVRLYNQARIYDVSCIATGSCALGQPLWQQTMANSVIPRVTFSRSGSTPMLYWATQLSCSNSTTGESLQDVSNPAAPRALVEPGYWRYYHWDTATGFNYIAPYEGKFLDDHFYRAAFSVLDVHRWGAAAAAAAERHQRFGVTQPGLGLPAGHVHRERTSPAARAPPIAGRCVTPSAMLWSRATPRSTSTPSQWITTGATPGTYRGSVVLNNAVGQSPPVQSGIVTVNGLTPLARSRHLRADQGRRQLGRGDVQRRRLRRHRVELGLRRQRRRVRPLVEQPDHRTRARHTSTPAPAPRRCGCRCATAPQARSPAPASSSTCRWSIRW